MRLAPFDPGKMAETTWPPGSRRILGTAAPDRHEVDTLFRLSSPRHHIRAETAGVIDLPPAVAIQTPIRIPRATSDSVSKLSRINDALVLFSGCDVIVGRL